MGGIQSKARSLGLCASKANKMEQRVSELHELGIIGLGKLERKLKNAPDLDTFRDYWLEGTYACIFAMNKLLVTLEPCGSKGPDMLVNIDGQSIYVEVKHLRQVNRLAKSPARVVSGTIRVKLKQTLNNKINIIVIHSGRIDISESAFYKGIYLCRDICQRDSLTAKKWPNLSCVIMHMPFFDSAKQEPFYWRFLRTSIKKVPRGVKDKVEKILKRQITIEHQKITQMPN